MRKAFLIAQRVLIALITICGLILAVAGVVLHSLMPLVLGLIGLAFPVLIYSNKD